MYAVQGQTQLTALNRTFLYDLLQLPGLLYSTEGLIKTKATT